MFERTGHLIWTIGDMRTWRQLVSVICGFGRNVYAAHGPGPDKDLIAELCGKGIAYEMIYTAEDAICIYL